ncbi:hypothetical protein [Piscinibacter sakaiensis]|uniref:hypothetical protein n=1 Tax=Piscinibacter sakaiensis TaxID=1547922 RepID=UPI003AAE3CBD
MNNRKIIAATILALFGGAAVAEGESKVNYTNQHLTDTRAEVFAETNAFNASHDGFLASRTEAYGQFDPAASVWASPEQGSIHADSGVAADTELRNNEAYGGFPQVSAYDGRGE